MGKATNPRPQKRSKGGRPRQEGDRYPSGKLRPPKPNSRVIELRAAMGLTKLGERMLPLEVAFARGWIEEEHYWAGCRYRALFRAAITDGPRFSGQSLPETTGSADVRALNFSQLSDSEIAQIWERAMEAPIADERDRPHALTRWRQVNSRLSHAHRQELLSVVCLESWPQWVLQRAAGRFDSSWEKKRDVLVAACAVLAQFGSRNENGTSTFGGDADDQAA